jgi:hypothetical protein
MSIEDIQAEVAGMIEADEGCVAAIWKTAGGVEYPVKIVLMPQDMAYQYGSDGTAAAKTIRGFIPATAFDSDVRPAANDILTVSETAYKITRVRTAEFGYTAVTCERMEWIKAAHANQVGKL